MNTRRSYLDTLNAGRQRRPEPPIEELDRTLAALEGRSQPAPQTRAAAGWPRGDYRPAAPRTQYEPGMPRGAQAADLRSLARDMERARRQEDGVSSASRIASELKAMREDLRQQMTQGLKREFDGLRQDIQRLGTARTPVSGGELATEFERLSDAVRTLSERSDDRSVNLLRLELEQVKGALDSLAREDTLKSVGRRWDEFDRKWTSLETKLGQDSARGAGQPDFGALSAQLERISETVNGLPESLSLRTLDERLKLLANTVDHFAAQYANAMPEAFGLIEQRLDEISRAVAASGAAARSVSFDPEPLERIEARVSSLARQIDELMDDQSSAVVSDRLTMLARRVDDIAERVDIPEEIVARLGQQLADISSRLDRAPAPSNADLIFNSLDERFAELSHMLERRQGDAMEQGNQLFSELERRLDEVAQRIEAREMPGTAADGALLEAIEQRFADLTARLSGGASQDRTAIIGLEARLDDVSRRLEQAAQRAEGIDPQIIQSLEAQVASLSQHLSRPGTPLPEFEDLVPRLAHIEKSLSGNREAILEAARQAAHDAVGSMGAQMGAQSGDPAAFAGLAGDLRALEAMTRKSDERNAKTFEAIHEMLIKVVDRLGSLEQTGIHIPAPAQRAARNIEAEPEPRAPARPAAPRSPAEAAAAAASHAVGEQKRTEQPAEGRRSMLSGLTRAFRKDKDAGEIEPQPIEPVMPAAATLDEPLDPKIANQPLEPGSGAPDLTAIIRRVRDEATAGPASAEAAKSDFIAAARRAAQAAAAEAQTTKRGTDALSVGTKLKLGDLLKNRRKTVLMAATALIVVIGGWQLTRAFVSGGPDDAPALATVAPEPAPVVAAVLPESADGQDMDAVEEETSAPAVRILDRSATDAATLAAPNAGPAAAPTARQAPEELAAVNSDVPMAAAPVTTNPVPVEAGPVALREAADDGDPKAMFEVASRYAEGRGVKADLARAAEWYSHSAELGYAPAQYRLGNLYEKGNGVDRDAAQAMAWYEKAAKQGNASAMHNLAVLYAMGASGAADNDAAARWFIEAAELGVTDSQYNLGILSAKGAGVPQSLEESYKWFALVAKAGDRDAAAKRDEVAKALRPEQLDKAKAAAELWKPRAVDPETNVVDIPEEWTEGQTQTASIADMKTAIRNIQAILSKNGYDAGTPDGVMGAKTKSAIMAFQADNGMTADGQVTQELVNALLERR
jgi:localization factor PodJL